MMDYLWEKVVSASRLDSLPVIDFLGNIWSPTGVVSVSAGFFGNCIEIGDGVSYLTSSISAFSPTNTTYPWCIEGYAECSSGITTRAGIFFFGDISSNLNRLQFEITPQYAVSLYSNSAGVIDYTTSPNDTVTPGVGFHYAVTRIGNVFTIYVNGLKVATKEFNMGPEISLNMLHLGTVRNGGAPKGLNGKMAEFKITSGDAKYTGSFSTPTDKFWFDAFKTYSGSVTGLATYPTNIHFLTERCEKIKQIETDSMGNFSVSLPVAKVRAICDSDSVALNSIILDNIAGV